MYIPYLSDFISLIYPLCCEACGRSLVAGEEVLCMQCRYELPRTNFWLKSGNPVEQVFWGRVRVEHACSLFFFTKGSRYRLLLHKLKYKDRPQIGVELGRLLGVELAQAPAYSDITHVVPIPLHAKRLAQRGYNQSEKIAEGIALSLCRPLLSDVIVRGQYTETQTKKTREERLKNMENVFMVVPQKQSQLVGQHLLLVDDVLTTGATIESCANAILSTVDCKISVATLAKASG